MLAYNQSEGMEGITVARRGAPVVEIYRRIYFERLGLAYMLY